ncbi:hypothetical protein [Prosthecobacter sp.]|uniref:hypothetical protein n=1 Tax=Prosthecobacter sp. TaxID=1965333 RepID=UPI003783DA56
MRANILSLSATLVLSVLTLFSTSCSTHTQKLDHRTIESLGGIALGKPRLDPRGHIILPIDCDVSGTRAITTTPTRLESALACLPPEITRKDQTIWLTLKTRTTKAGLSSKCPDLDLGKLSPETYLVYYRDPDGSEHPIGVVLTKNLRW